MVRVLVRPGAFCLGLSMPRRGSNWIGGGWAWQTAGASAIIRNGSGRRFVRGSTAIMHRMQPLLFRVRRWCSRLKVVLGLALACTVLAGCDDASPGCPDVTVRFSGTIESTLQYEDEWYIFPVRTAQTGRCEPAFLRGLGRIPSGCSEERSFTAVGIIGDGPLFAGDALKVTSINCS